MNEYQNLFSNFTVNKKFENITYNNLVLIIHFFLYQLSISVSIINFINDIHSKSFNLY